MPRGSQTKDTRVKRHQAIFARVNKRHQTILPPWTEDTRQFCHPGQKTPEYFATLDRRHHLFSKLDKKHQIILQAWRKALKVFQLSSS